jgi:hypothetical protein
LPCLQCKEMNAQDSALCSNCGTSLTRQPGPAELSAPSTPASQFPRTPGDQFIPNSAAVQYTPDPPTPVREFRPDLRRLSRADQAAGSASLVVLVSLFLPWFGIGGLGTNISVSGTTAHGYFLLVVILVVLMCAYLLLRSGWEEFPVSLPVRHEPLLLAGVSLQFLLVIIGFSGVPAPGLSREIGAYLALIASVAAVGAVVWPAIRARQARR